MTGSPVVVSLVPADETTRALLSTLGGKVAVVREVRNEPGEIAFAIVVYRNTAPRKDAH